MAWSTWNNSSITLQCSWTSFERLTMSTWSTLKFMGPAAILQWDGWREMSEEDYYCLLFERAKEGMAKLFPEATGLYYYIGMDQNVGQLWKRTPAHGMIPSIEAVTNNALTNFEMVDTTAAGGSTTPPRKDSKPLLPAINITTGEEAKMTDTGGSPQSM
ncbi:hypothetical protein C0993_005134 [Termitomyces sp. T159_Od127]|nr:hypothetical protein C0993_005134 [Termitomyces sp. T159_Od127]